MTVTAIEFQNVPHVDIVVPDFFDSFELELLYVRTMANNNSGYGAVLTCLLGDSETGPVDGGPNYTNGGLYEWTPMGNDPYGNVIGYGNGPGASQGGFADITPYGVKPVGSEKRTARGCRLNGDNLEALDLATSGLVRFQCPGTVLGQPVSPRYFAKTVMDEGNWSHNSAQFHYAGFWHRPGVRIRKIRTCANINGGAPLATITGRMLLKTPAEVAPPPPPPPPVVTFTPIGDFNNLAKALDGVTSKGAGQGAWKVGTTGWIGKKADDPWSATTLTVYGSNNDGFVFGHPPTPFAQITANFYESDGVPTGPTDGVLVQTKVITDTDSIPSVSFNVPAGNRLSRWVVLTHNQASTSMYVSAVI